MGAFKSLLEETAQRLGKDDITDPEVQAKANRELEKLARAHITFRLQRISLSSRRPEATLSGLSEEDTDSRRFHQAVSMGGWQRHHLDGRGEENQ